MEKHITQRLFLKIIDVSQSYDMLDSKDNELLEINCLYVL